MTSPQRLPLSVFFPAYNDAQSIGKLVSDAIAVLQVHSTDYEVIVVNDGSADNTAEVLEELRIRHAPFVKVVTHAQNQGYGAALRSGFGAATKDFVFYTDGDGQYDVNELPKLIALMDGDVGLVNGFKLNREDPGHRVLIGFLYNRFARFLFGVRIRDIDCDFRLIRREALRHASLRSTSGTICVELVRMLELGPWKVVETGVRHYPRLHGRSQFFRFAALFTTFAQLLKLYCRVVIFTPEESREHETA